MRYPIQREVPTAAVERGLALQTAAVRFTLARSVLPLTSNTLVKPPPVPGTYVRVHIHASSSSSTLPPLLTPPSSTALIVVGVVSSSFALFFSPQHRMPGSRSATQSQRMMNHPDLQPPARVPSSKAALSSKLGGYSTKAPAVDGLAISYDATEQSSYQPEQPLQNDSDYREVRSRWHMHSRGGGGS